MLPTKLIEQALNLITTQLSQLSVPINTLDRLMVPKDLAGLKQTAHPIL